MLSYSVVFIKKKNLLGLHHWCFPGKLTNFLKQQKQPPHVFCYKRPTNFTTQKLNTGFFLWILQKILRALFWRTFAKNNYSKEHHRAAVCILTLIINSDNLLTGYIEGKIRNFWRKKTFEKKKYFFFYFWRSIFLFLWKYEHPSLHPGM